MRITIAVAVVVAFAACALTVLQRQWQRKERVLSEEVPVKKYKAPPLPRLQGIVLPVMQNAKSGSVANFSNLELSPTDVISVSYSKTGTTWVHHILYLLLRMNDDGSMVEMAGDVIAQGPLYPDFLPMERPEKPHPLVGFKTYADLLEQPSPRLLSSHLPPQFLPEAGLAKQGRLVYLMRNPKDTLVSLHHFMKKMDPILKNPGYEARGLADWTGHPDVEGTSGSYGDFNAWPNEAFPRAYGSYYWHIQEMGKLIARLGPRATCVYYEQLHEDLHGELQRLATFLGVSLGEKKLDEIVKRVSFESMAGNSELRTVKNTMRKGIVGDHKQHLTAELWQAMDEIFEQRLGHVAIAQPLRKWL